MVICFGGDTEVLGPATSVGAVVLGAEGSRGAGETEALGNGVVVAGAGPRMHEPDAHRYALLEVASPLQDGQLLAGPRLAL